MPRIYKYKKRIALPSTGAMMYWGKVIFQGKEYPVGDESLDTTLESKDVDPSIRLKLFELLNKNLANLVFTKINDDRYDNAQKRILLTLQPEGVLDFSVSETLVKRGARGKFATVETQGQLKRDEGIINTITVMTFTEEADKALYGRGGRIAHYFKHHPGIAVSNVFFWLAAALVLLFLLTNPIGLSLSLFVGIITGGGALLGILITAFLHERTLYPAQKFSSEEGSGQPLSEQEASASYDHIMAQISGLSHELEEDLFALTKDEHPSATPLFHPTPPNDFESILQGNFYAKSFFHFLDTVPSQISHSVNKETSQAHIQAMKEAYLNYIKSKRTSKREALENTIENKMPKEYTEFLTTCEKFVQFVKELKQQNAGKFGLLAADLDGKLKRLVEADQPSQPHPSFLSH